MVRTGDGGVRISGGKSSKKGGGGGGSRSSGTPSKKSGGGDGRLHSGVQREIPSWQKPITNFFNMPPASSSTKAVNKEESDEGCLNIDEFAVEVSIHTEDDKENKEEEK